jgi:hypothetical protein
VALAADHLLMDDGGVRDLARRAQERAHSNAERDLAIIKMKRGEVQLMDGDFAAALASFHQARATLAPMARVDPQNNMLQLDVAEMNYEEGRLVPPCGIVVVRTWSYLDHTQQAGR